MVLMMAMIMSLVYNGQSMCSTQCMRHDISNMLTWSRAVDCDLTNENMKTTGKVANVTLRKLFIKWNNYSINCIHLLYIVKTFQRHR